MIRTLSAALFENQTAMLTDAAVKTPTNPND
jgi:hypothetical protein